MTEQQRRKALARARVDLVDVLDEDDGHAPMNRKSRRTMQRELVKQMRHRAGS